MTTNPTIIKRDRPGWRFGDVVDFLKELRGRHFVQISLKRYDWVEKLEELGDDRYNREKFVIKIPWDTLRVGEIVKILKELGFRTCATAVYTISQYMGAVGYKIDYTAVYFDRMRRSGMDALSFIHDILKLQNIHDGPKILVASLKRYEDVDSVLKAGVDSITLPLDLFSKYFEVHFPMNDLERFEEDYG